MLLWNSSDTFIIWYIDYCCLDYFYLGFCCLDCCCLDYCCLDYYHLNYCRLAYFSEISLKFPQVNGPKSLQQMTARYHYYTSQSQLTSPRKLVSKCHAQRALLMMLTSPVSRIELGRASDRANVVSGLAQHRVGWAQSATEVWGLYADPGASVTSRTPTTLPGWCTREPHWLITLSFHQTPRSWDLKTPMWENSWRLPNTKCDKISL